MGCIFCHPSQCVLDGLILLAAYAIVHLRGHRVCAKEAENTWSPATLRARCRKPSKSAIWTPLPQAPTLSSWPWSLSQLPIGSLTRTNMRHSDFGNRRRRSIHLWSTRYDRNGR
ncbi:hypothetical protein C8Q77DRAFT_661998 [Trametes polyzona]|nr:hypothetical protein C8Q77DRAFT_661998 [Trametes polyzona]